MSFLFNEEPKIRELAVRIWFDFDGSISPMFKLKQKTDKKGDRLYTYTQIQFECEIYLAETNPYLVKDLLALCSSLGLNGRIAHDKRKWSGIGGVCISNLNSVKKFVKMGPITDICVSAKSSRFRGVKKMDVCKAVHSLLGSDLPRSRYFTDKQDAITVRKDLNRVLEDKIRRDYSPVV